MGLTFCYAGGAVSDDDAATLINYLIPGGTFFFLERSVFILFRKWCAMRKVVIEVRSIAWCRDWGIA